MQEFEAYSLLFTDSFVANFILGFSNELIIYPMKIFSSYNSLIILLVSTSAAACAFTLNYLLGRILLNIFYFSKNEQNILLSQPLIQFFIKYKIIILSFVIFPFWGNIIALLAGFIKMSFTKMLSICTFVKLCYYAYIIYVV